MSDYWLYDDKIIFKPEFNSSLDIYNDLLCIVIKQDFWKNPEICFISYNTKNNFFILKNCFIAINTMNWYFLIISMHLHVWKLPINMPLNTIKIIKVPNLINQ